MLNIRTIIVDDEPLALEGIKLRLAQCQNVEVIAECHNGEEAIREARLQQPDLIFLDLEMPGLTGLEVVQALQSDVMPFIIFVTAYEKFSLAAFELNAVDYILKPANLERIQNSINRVREQMQSSKAHAHKSKLLQALSELTGADQSSIESCLENETTLPHTGNADCLAIKTRGKGTAMIPVKDIKWIDAAGDYMCIHTESETHIMRSTLRKLETRLGNNFLRVHKSTIINTQHICEILPHTNGESILLINDGTRLKASRKYRDDIQRYLQSKLL